MIMIASLGLCKACRTEEPEPGTLVSAGSALAALGFFVRRKRLARGTNL